MREIRLAVIPRDAAREAVRWAVVTHVAGDERSLVSPIDRLGRVADKSLLARGTVSLTPPPGWQATVMDGGRAVRAVYTEDGVVTAAGPRSGGAADATPTAFRDGVPVVDGPALTWARRVGFRVAANDAAQFALHWQLAEHRLRARADGLEGAAWLDIAITNHQRAVVAEVLGAPTVRHILADEVGLGKTIEALMIWSALSADSPDLRTVVTCPKELVPQWCLEVRRRTEHAPRARRWEDLPPVYVPLDDRVEDSLLRPNRRGLVVASHEGLEELARRKAPVDLLIVDEAHRLTLTARDAARKSARGAAHVLLLTATPRESARRLAGAARSRATPFAWALSIIDPRCAPFADDLPSVEARLEEQYAFLRTADSALGADLRPSTELLARAAALSGDTPLTARSRADLRALAREATYFERVVATRRRQIPSDQTPQRRLCEITVDYREEELQVFRALRDMDAESSARARVRRYSSSSWVALADGARGLSEAARKRLAVIREARVDAKLDALLDLCARIWRDDAERKLVIRCEYGPTFSLVSTRLRELLMRGALRTASEEDRESWNSEGSVGPVACLEEGTEHMITALVNPERAGTSMLAHFNAFERRGPGSAPVLVARDVAAVGLNLQFSQDLVFYDVPWQLGLAEQWIGRLDRLGQRGRELRVHVLTHPASPVKELTDLYVALKLFDASARRTTELDEHISSLIAKADSDEIQWSDVVARARRLLDEDARESDAELAIDLKISDGRLDATAERESNAAVVRAFGRAGFTVEVQETRFEIGWPRGKDRDVVDLPEVRSHLRPYARAIGGRNNTPEDQAAKAEQAEHERVLRVEANRLSDSRWVRGAAVDFLTPRHALLSEALGELSADPTMCLGAFRIPRPRGFRDAGAHALALTSTCPAAAVAAILWGARALEPSAVGDPAEDAELRQIYEQLEGGLRRSLCIAFPPHTAVRAWRLGATGSEHHELTEGAATMLRDALTDGARVSLGAAAALPMKRVLEFAERAPEGTDHLPAAAAIERAMRHLRLVAATVLGERQASLDAVGRDTALRGIRDHHQKRLDVASEFFARLGRPLEREWLSLADDASTPRVVTAAWIEVQ